MKSNKIFYIKNLAFNLPDDFNGGLNEALEEIIKYRKSGDAKTNRFEGKYEPNKDVFDRIGELWNNDTYKLHLEFGAIEYDNKDEEWNFMNLKLD